MKWLPRTFDRIIFSILYYLNNLHSVMVVCIRGSKKALQWGSDFILKLSRNKLKHRNTISMQLYSVRCRVYNRLFLVFLLTFCVHIYVTFNRLEIFIFTVSHHNRQINKPPPPPLILLRKYPKRDEKFCNVFLDYAPQIYDGTVKAANLHILRIQICYLLNVCFRRGVISKHLERAPN